MTIYGGFYLSSKQQQGVWLEPGQMALLVACGVGWGLDLFAAEPSEGAYRDLETLRKAISLGDEGGWGIPAEEVISELPRLIDVGE